MASRLTRRRFLQTSAVGAVGLGLSSYAMGENQTAPSIKPKITPKADSMILIWLPGGMAQTDMWDPKKFTPFRAGMKGNELLGTCKPIPTSADGIFLGEGMEGIASQMKHGTILRTLTNETKFGAVHLKAQYYAMTGYLFPSGFKAPSIGSVVARSLGRRDKTVPPYIYIGRDIDTSDEEKLFISEYLGPGFYGVNYAPFMIPEPAKGLATLNAVAGMKMDRLDRRQELLKKISGMSAKELQDSSKVQDYMKVMDEARAMMDSPVKKAFDFKDEKAELIAAYQPKITADQQLEPGYYNGGRFGNGLLLARRLVERGARFVQVEYQYGPFKGFDMHENGQKRMTEMKKQIDGPIAQLIKDLDERGLLERTLVCIMTEFGRTIASAPSAGQESEGFAERNTGEKLVLDSEKMYGFHGHFSSCNCMTFFGGGFKRGSVYGKTADEHPMLAVDKPVNLDDTRATIYKALGIAADHNYVTEGRPVFVTKDGKGQAIDGLLA
ncbi:MAG: hypothetical protein JWM68_2846 [Verrucomicrobiales bacterium]|nr:hypothetical protein [Verrucomicrobiales bacterium]